MATLAQAQFTIIDYSDVTISPQPPTPTADLLWLDTSSTPNVLKRWDSNMNSWVNSTALSLAELDSVANNKLNDVSTTLGNMANDSKLTQQERFSINDKVAEIIGFIPSSSPLPTYSSLENSVKAGEFYNVRRQAVNAGISTSVTEYIALETAYTALSNYLNGITNPYPWDYSSTVTNTGIVGTTWRSKWLDYYKAVQGLEVIIAQKLKQNADDINVGGRNILRNSTGLMTASGGTVGQKYWNSNTSVSIESSLGYNSFRIYHNISISFDSIRYTVKPNTQYTISYLVKTDNYNTTTIVGAFGRQFNSPNTFDNGMSWTDNYTNTSTINTFIQRSFTFTTQSNTYELFIRLSTQGDGIYKTICFSQIKLEEGNKRTSWTQAPEDIDEAINDKVSTTATYNNVKIDSSRGLVATKMSGVKQIAEAILNGTEGIKIRINNGTLNAPAVNSTDWKDVFSVDTNGNLITNNMTANDLTIQRVNLKDNSGNTVLQLDGSTSKFDLSKITTVLGKAEFMKGITITDSLGNETFSVGIDGIVTVAGNITMKSGTITWGASGVTPPTYSDVGAKPASYTAYGELGSTYLTNIGSNGIYTGTLTANQIISGTIDAKYISTNISQVNNEIRLGNITDETQKYIRFSGTSSISGTNDGYMTIHGDLIQMDFNNVIFPSTSTAKFYGNANFEKVVDFSTATSINWGTNAPVAVFG